MKKLLLILLFAVLSGGAAWYAWPEQRANEVAEPAPQAVNKPAEDLQARVSAIISQPIIFKNPLSESAKEKVSAKLRELTDLIKNNYDYVNAWYDLGSYRKMIGDYEGAIEAWNFAVTIRPQEFVAYHNLGDLYAFYLKDYAKAEKNFLKSVGNNTANVDGYVQLATIYENFYKKDTDAAENILLSGIKNNPSSAHLKIVLGQYYERAQRLGEALQYLEEALKLDPTNKVLEEEIARLKNS